MKPRENIVARHRILIVLVLSLLTVLMAGLSVSHSVRADNIKYAKTLLYQGETKQLKLMVADPPKVTWTSDNTNVAVVNQSGFVQTLGIGGAVITASVNGNNYMWPINVFALKINKTSLQLLERRGGDSLSLNNKRIRNAVSWSSSHPGVASVNSSGKVTPLSAGHTVITAKWNNYKFTCNVTVLEVSPQTLRNYRNPNKSSNRKKVVLAGSALWDYWLDCNSAFGSTVVINNGITRSTITDWLGYYKKLITDYKPKAVVLSMGMDDINFNHQITAEQMAQNMQQLITNIHSKSGKTKIFFCSVPLYPDREQFWGTITSYNALIRDFCSKNKYATYLNLTGPLLKNGVPNPAYFLRSCVHLSSSGYNVTKKVVVKKVRKAAK